MDYQTPLDMLDSDNHPLLDQSPPAYSHTTVRRAFIVWLRCGQRNQFRDVCDYYHRLEAMEDQLSVEMRAISHNHEFSLFTSEPPTSLYLQQTFPNLYTSSPIENQGYSNIYLQNYYATMAERTENCFRVEEIKEDLGNNEDRTQRYDAVKLVDKPAFSHKEIFETSQAFRSDCKFEELKQKNRIGLAFAKLNIDEVKLNEVAKEKSIVKEEGNEMTGTSKKDIIETSEMIKNYCKDHQVPLKNFLENFKEHASRCELTNTVTNVGLYIKRKMVEAELDLAVKVHRAKVLNNGNKENRFKSTSSPKLVKSTKKCETLNVDNEALVNGFAKLRMKVAKTNENNETKPDVPAAKVFGVKTKNTEKTITLLKRENGDPMKSSKGFSNGHNIAKIDTVKCRKI